MWKVEFVAMLKDMSLGLDGIDEAMELKDRHLPPRLYRYRRPIRVDEITADAVWLSRPSEFNDPFDTAITMHPERMLPQLMERGMPDVLATVPKRKRAEIEEISRALAADPSCESMLDVFARRHPKLMRLCPPGMAAVIRKVMMKQFTRATSDFSRWLQQSLLACSFSEVVDSVLMWSHYADEHRGFCIEYPIDAIEKSDVRRRLLYLTCTRFPWTQTWGNDPEGGGSRR